MKTDDEYIIRKAVELADGWRWYESVIDPPVPLNPIMQDSPTPQTYLDALAAQLVRQVDRTEYSVEILNHAVQMRQLIDESDATDFFFPDPRRPRDRTMNTIKAIVDSKILES